MEGLIWILTLSIGLNNLMTFLWLSLKLGLWCPSSPMSSLGCYSFLCPRCPQITVNHNVLSIKIDCGLMSGWINTSVPSCFFPIYFIFIFSRSFFSYPVFGLLFLTASDLQISHHCITFTSFFGDMILGNNSPGVALKDLLKMLLVVCFNKN